MQRVRQAQASLADDPWHPRGVAQTHRKKPWQRATPLLAAGWATLGVLFRVSVRLDPYASIPLPYSIAWGVIGFLSAVIAWRLITRDPEGAGPWQGPGRFATTTALLTLVTLVIALNYGGRREFVLAARRLAAAAAAGALDPTDICEDDVGASLFTAGIPDPDLFIRTGGEHRVSNFLLWQLAYTEFYFSDCLWPDFDAAEMQKALDEYGHRQRRFGKTGEQVEASTAC